MARRVLWVMAAFLAIAALIHFDQQLCPDQQLYMDSGGIKELPRTSGAMEALNFWTRSRAYPHQDLPAEGYFKAYRYVTTQLAKTSRSLDESSSWRAMGPLNVPGRMISLAVNPRNPRTLYAGSASGGLWVTHAAETGINWQRVTTGFPTLGVMAIAIDAADTNTIYIGTGEVYGYSRSIGGQVIRTTRGSYGIGILKTVDGGLTWAKSLDWTASQQKGVQCIRINPLNSRSLYAATSEGIYKSTDAGGSWQQLLAVFMGEDIIIHPVDTSKVMVSCGNLGSAGSGLYRTTNAGQSWAKLTGIPPFSGKTLMDFYAANPNIVFASVADSLNGIGLYRTTNFGDSWTVLHNSDVPSYQGWFSHWVAVHPTDLTQVAHAGVQIYQSDDGGSSLLNVASPQPHVDHHNFAHDPQNPAILYIACDGGVYRSTNFGASYQGIGYGLQTAQFYNGISCSRSDSTLAMGGLQDNGLVIYRGSLDWQNVAMGDGCWTATNTLNDNILYAESQYNSINKSTNRGISFSAARSGLTGNAAFVAPYGLAPSSPSIMYSGRKKVFKSSDGAGNWVVTNNNQQLDGNYILSMAIAPKEPDVVYVGTAPGVSRAHLFRTANGGESWQNVTGSLPDRYPMDLAVDPENHLTVYAVFGGFGSGHVYKSVDGGTHWQDITGTLPDLPTVSLAIDPLCSDHIYVGNDLGVYASTDAGATWNVFSEGLPEAVIAADLNADAPNRALRLATHGNGAYQRPLLYKPAVYLVYTLSSLPAVVTSGSEVKFEATVTNIGTETQNDTSEIEVRVVDYAQMELYSSTKRISGLTARESRHIEFEGLFVPSAVGDYSVEFIRFATAYQPVQDTTRQTLSVISAPTISQALVVKEYRPYQEVGGMQGVLSGDDVQGSTILPFTFLYDGYEYDKVQVSTNGWVEFGIGPDGSARGLSTASQIGTVGANQNGSLGTTERPTKALGPWWEDLNTATTGQVGHVTLGNAPNRIFVIQWKNMLAYYDELATTTRVNFQVRLYEESDTIEYHYGPVLPGTFSGADIGAMIGFKDHIGGDYRYYDIIAGGTGLTGDIITTLSPLTDWPGPDSCFVIRTASSSVADDDAKMPVQISLSQNYPNPFNPTTTIRYYLSRTERVSLKIYNSLGREVRALVDEMQNAGIKTVVWDGRDSEERQVSSGVYMYRLSVRGEVVTRKMMLIK